MQSLAELAGRAAGELIKHDDWNDLVGHVTALTERLDSELAELQTQVDTLSEREAATSQRLDALATTVEELIEGKFRVTLTTTRSRALLGEQLVLEARLTDLAGNAADLTALTELPWVDFVAVWGRFRRVSPFVTRTGADSRSASVQVNADGVARVALRAEQMEGVTEETEDEVAGVITPAIRDAIFTTANPAEAHQQGAFQAFTLEYRREDTPAFRHFTDIQFLGNRNRVGPSIFRQPTHRWRDYRTTAMAFVKADDTPGSADLSHGGATITVTFRDWTGPWLALDFFQLAQPEVDGVARRIGQAFGANNSFRLANEAVGGILFGMQEQAGFLGRLRDMRLFDRAFDEVTLDEPPPFFLPLRESYRHAIALQGAVEGNPVQPGGENAGLELVMDLANRSERTAEEAAAGISGVSGQVAELGNGLSTNSRRVDELADELDGVRERASGLEAVTNQVNERLGSVDNRFNLVENRFSTVDSVVADLTQVAQRADTRAEGFTSRFDGLTSQITLLAGGNADLNRRLETVNQRVERTVDVERFNEAQLMLNANLERLGQNVPNFQPQPFIFRGGGS